MFAADAGDEGASGEGSSDGARRNEDTLGEGARSILNTLRSRGIAPRWRTRVIAVECLRDALRVLSATSVPSAGSDKRKQSSRQAVPALDWLADLVAVGFTAATSSVHALRASGLQLLKDVILVRFRFPWIVSTLD